MPPPPKITAIVGTYRRGGVIDSAVDEILAGALEAGAAVEKIHLLDKRIEFCDNCRACMQPPGPARGPCHMDDDMAAILDTIAQSDAIVLASPMNMGSVTALMKRFLERLGCVAYWPWGASFPRMRNKPPTKRAVVVGSSAAPTLLARLFTGMVRMLKMAAGALGAKTVGVLFIGMASREPRPVLTGRTRTKARRLGRKLATRA